MKKLFLVLVLFIGIAEAKGTIGSPEVSVNSEGNYLIEIQMSNFLSINENDIKLSNFKSHDPLSDESIEYTLFEDLESYKRLTIALPNDFTKEEMKLVWETHKILDPRIFVQATCVRVPVFNGHSEAVFFKVSKNTSRNAIIELLDKAEGIKVIDNPEQLEYPTPVEHANDSEEVFVGRIRVQELASETWVSLWIVADNVYGKGAALNAVQIAERLLKTDKF